MIKKMSAKSCVYFQGKYIFLTVPGLQVSQEDIVALKQRTFREILDREDRHLEHLGVARECHKSGSFHLHIYVQYKARRKLSPKHFDYLVKHPNVQVVRGLKQVLDYLCKEDTKPLCSRGFNPL